MSVFVKIPRFPFKVLLLLVSITMAFQLKNADTPFAQISFKNSIQNFSIDRYDLLYVAEANGDVHKIDTLGNKLLTYSPQKKAELTLMESWRNVNILLFYRNFQEIYFLDRFLANNSSAKLSQYSNIGFARLVTQGSDNNLWVIDEQDFTLKKLDLTFNQVLLSTSLDLILDPDQYDLIYLREYQNQLYLVDRNQGIMVFDIMGNYKLKIPASNIQFANFKDDELYYLSQDSVRLVHLYNYQKRSIALPQKGAKSVLLGKNTQYLIYENRVDCYKGFGKP